MPLGLVVRLLYHSRSIV